MDERFKTLALTFFSGELTTTDVMALKLHLLDTAPTDTVFCTDENNKFMIDYKYETCLTSHYLNKKTKSIQPDQYQKYSPAIATELTNYDIILEDVCAYINESRVLKRFVKLYKTNNRKQNIKIIEASKRLKIALNKGIDYDYIKEVF
ncbi:m75R [Myxoma virus]|uniref:M75R n=2 Tax=Myxoma virus TaxID=10273 RepID=Q9Q8M5_MYXVL|nr:m75R [Myxoma virus]ACB28870.1 m75R [recombinant virus 6918VP60-T2]AAF14963.1 m75R [Myxoma virus]ACB28698.1 m75R [Myxoma virus]ADK63715.1 m75R [Myxoma virus]AFU77007.1 m75R [Myxoma virus]